MFKAGATEVVASGAGLWKSFGDVVALKGMDLCVRAGTVTGFLGPNGAGKTTTLRMLAGLTTPDRGQVRTFDVNRSWSPWLWALGEQPVSDGVAIGPLFGVLGLIAALVAGGTLAVERRDIHSP